MQSGSNVDDEAILLMKFWQNGGTISEIERNKKNAVGR
jgi:hypothetical protein